MLWCADGVVRGAHGASQGTRRGCQGFEEGWQGNVMGKSQRQGVVHQRVKGKVCRGWWGGKRCLANRKGRGTTGLLDAGFSAAVGLAAGHPAKRGRRSSPAFCTMGKRRGETGNAGFLAHRKPRFHALHFFSSFKAAETCFDMLWEIIQWQQGEMLLLSTRCADWWDVTVRRNPNRTLSWTLLLPSSRSSRSSSKRPASPSRQTPSSLPGESITSHSFVGGFGARATIVKGLYPRPRLRCPVFLARGMLLFLPCLCLFVNCLCLHAA
jgi:hypothetical protein